MRSLKGAHWTRKYVIHKNELFPAFCGVRVVTVPVSVPFSVPVQNCRNFSVFRF